MIAVNVLVYLWLRTAELGSLVQPQGLTLIIDTYCAVALSLGTLTSDQWSAGAS